MESKIESAAAFWSRVDAFPGVSEEHPAFVPGAPEIKLPKSRVRRIGMINMFVESDPIHLPQGQYHISSFSPNLWIPVMYCNLRFVMQVLRPLILPLFAMGITIINIVDLTNHFSDAADAEALRNVFNTVGAVIVFLLLWSIHYDSILQRAWFSVKSKVVEGIYYYPSEYHSKVLECSPRLREKHESTPWTFTGDFRTLLPFIAFNHDMPTYTRRWLKMADGEACAVDIVLPTKGFDKSKPIIVVLHGLNGGSTEPYVLDLVHRALDLGHAVMVMVARGLMQTPIVHGRAFTGARITDVHNAVQLARSVAGVGGRVAVVGYSMGGLIASNYAALAPPQSGLVGVIALSASADLRSNMEYEISRRVWQPILTLALKQNLILPYQHLLSHPGPSRLEIDIRRLEAAQDIVGLDAEFTSKFGGWNSVGEYYDDASCGAKNKLDNLRIPLCMLHAEDDPILPVDGLLPAVDCVKKAQDGQISSEGGRNLLVVVTRQGGHVGWPTGLNPMKSKWVWMSECILQYVNAAADNCEARVEESRRRLIEIVTSSESRVPVCSPFYELQQKYVSGKLSDTDLRKQAEQMYPCSTIQGYDLGELAPLAENPIPAEIEAKELQQKVIKGKILKIVKD